MGEEKQACFLYCRDDVINGVFDGHHFTVVEYGKRMSPVEFIEGPLTPFCCEDAWGLFDAQGDVVVPPEFEEIDEAYEVNPDERDRDYLIVWKDGKAGVDTDGDRDPDRGVTTSVKHVLPIAYDDIQCVVSHEPGEDAFVVKKQGKWGMVDAQGHVVLPLVYDEFFWPEGACDWTGNPIDAESCKSRSDLWTIVHRDFFCLRKSDDDGDQIFLLPLKDNPTARLKPEAFTQAPMWIYPLVGRAAVCFVKSHEGIGMLDREARWVIPLQPRDAFAHAFRKFLRDRRRKSRKIGHAWRMSGRIERREVISPEQLRKFVKQDARKYRRKERKNRYANI